MSSKSGLKKLSEENLTRQPEEVFDIICKLGEGSYGSVYKALHKESGQVLAIKQVPVDTDLQEIIKEISIMQQCDSPYVVKYYGSYFKNTDLWIVMEYCGAGSVSDIMRLRKKTLTEDEIATILCDTLKGLEYLHLRRKIHRDIKAGNILLNSEGHAKLADFGVAGHLGITALEMAEGKPPYGDIHPMRAIFMIPTKPPPSFREPDKWSPEFIDFVSSCLVKNPEDRATATDLLAHDFVGNTKAPTILSSMIQEAREIRESQSHRNSNSVANMQLKQNTAEESDDEVNVGNQTMLDAADEGTLTPNRDGTLVPSSPSGTLIEIESDLGTMVINSDIDDQTMKNHFDKKEAEIKQGNGVPSPSSPIIDISDVDNKIKEQKYQSNFHVQLNQNSPQTPPSPQKVLSQEQKHSPQYHKPFSDGDFEFQKMNSLDLDMEREIDALRKKYQVKRQPILDAMDTKRKKSQNF
nr:unnamed protein product [Callosobruchus chinensis]